LLVDHPLELQLTKPGHCTAIGTKDSGARDVQAQHAVLNRRPERYPKNQDRPSQRVKFGGRDYGIGTENDAQSLFALDIIAL
jgi:hypothetical protein